MIPPEQRPGQDLFSQAPEISKDQGLELPEIKPTRPQKRKEIPPYEVRERISRNIEIDTGGKYHVWWGEGKGRQHHGPFETTEEVMHQHERVVMGYLGYEVPSDFRMGRNFLTHGKEFLQMKGESQEMAEIGNALLGLMSEFPQVRTKQERERLERRLYELRAKIGKAKSAYKQAASSALEVAIVAPQLGVKMGKTGEAAKDVFERTQETIRKAEGTIYRWNKCEAFRDQSERNLLEIYRGLIRFKKMMDEERLGENESKGLIRVIQGPVRGREKTYLDLLNGVTGLPYKKRAEDRRLRRLARVEDYIGQGDKKALSRTLTEAIDCLWRVFDDRRKRFEGEKKEYLKREG